MQTRRTLLAGSALGLLGASVSGCGTILYPERKGQIDGKIDPGVAILDGLGLLLFLLPGVIAFAVDFNNGTIYLPSNKSAESGGGEVKSVRFAGPLTEPKLDRIWIDRYGHVAPFKIDDLERQAIENTADIATVFHGLEQTNFTRA